MLLSQVFERLDQVCGGKEWDRLSMGARTACAWMEHPSSSMVGFPKVEKKIRKEGEKTREELGKIGTISFNRLIEKGQEAMGAPGTEGKRSISIEMDDRDQNSRVSDILDMVSPNSIFEPGDRVQIHGLVSASQHNGKMGKIISKTRERAEVRRAYALLQRGKYRRFTVDAASFASH